MSTLRVVLCLLASSALSAGQQSDEPRLPKNITTEEIVARMAERNGRRQNELQSYTVRREYHLVYTGFPGRHEADLVVEVKYQFPDNKDFVVISESGSHWIINHVFKRILETEKEAADKNNRVSTALTDQNYKFELLSEDDIDNRPAYVLRVEPKTDNRLLYRGMIWVDAADFALCKIEGEPARRPSMWISKIQVHHTYSKIGDFWLPTQNESDTDVRLGGHAALSIEYRNYRVVSDSSQSPSAAPGDPPRPVVSMAAKEQSH